MAQNVQLDHAGIEEFLKSVQVRAELTRRGQRVLAAAKSSAPVVTGTYRDSLKVVQDTTDRAVVRVISDAVYAMQVEANHGTLAKSLDAAK